MNAVIIDYESKYKDDFKRLNLEWIEKYFKIEEEDQYYLENPDSNIIDKGGVILLAVKDNEIIGTIALLKRKELVYELAKMTVKEKYRGKGIGWKLLESAIEKAKDLKAHSVYLETNSSLRNSIHLYRKAGFIEVKNFKSSYQRGDVQMILNFHH